MKLYIAIFIVWFVLTVQGNNSNEDASVQDSCVVPSGEWYQRLIFRPRNRKSQAIFSPGARVAANTNVTIICKQDRYYDAIHKWTLSTCSRGNWYPALPMCRTYRRCSAPPSISGATSSEPNNEAITFPHQAEVTFTCNTNNATSATVNCNDGQWTKMDLKCEEKVSVDECLNARVGNGLVRKMNKFDDSYYVICNFGFRLENKTKKFRCQKGQWENGTPTCVPAYCKITERDLSVFKYPHLNKLVGSQVHHGLKVQQKCNNVMKVIKCEYGRWIPDLLKCNPNHKPASMRIVEKEEEHVELD